MTGGIDTSLRPAPTTEPTRRSVGVDVARGVAVLGMFAAHFNPGQLDPGDLLRQVVSGRSAVLFVVLAGVSITFLTGRPPGVRGLVVRSVVLFGLGSALSALGTPVKEILTVYGVLFLLAIPLLVASTGVLVAVAAVGAVVGPVLSFVLRSGPLGPGIPGRTPQPADLVSPDGLATMLQGLLLGGPYPVLTWLPFLVVGLLVGRGDLADPRFARRLVVHGSLAGTIAGLASWLATGPLGGLRAIAGATGLDPAVVRATAAQPLGAVPLGHPAYLLIGSPHSGAPLEIVSSAGWAVAVLGGCLLIGARFPCAAAPLAGTGRLALSCYVGHILLIAAIGLPGMVDLLTRYGHGLLLLVVVATPLISLGWAAWVGRGPLERVVSAAARWGGSVGSSRRGRDG